MREILAGPAVCLAAVAAVAFPAVAPADADVGDELLTNGGFEKLDSKSWPVGWRGFAGAEARRQKGNTWIELSRYGSCTQEIALDADWMKLKVAFRMRVTGVTRGDDGWKNARLAMEWRDANGGHLGPWPDVIWAEGTTDWQGHERIFVIPQGAAGLQIAPAMFGKPGGKAEYDDISVTLLRKRAAKKEDLPVPKGYERAWDFADAWRQRSATRETVCLNGLWRFLPAPDGNAAAPPEGVAGWGWFKVPGVWPRLLGDAPQELLLSGWMEDRTDLAALDQAWYLRKITVPEGWKRRRVFVDFAMLQTHARVFLDGRQAGERFFPGGLVEVTEHVRCGTEQTLAILVTARPLEQETTTFMAPERIIKSKASIGLRGLTGDVFLVSRPGGEWMEDVRITTSVRHSVIRIDARIAGPGGSPRVLRARILEKGKVVKEFSSAPLGAADLQGGLACVTASWPDAKPWDTHTPGNLYDAVVGLVDGDGKVLDETLPISFGFREFRIDGRDFYLNGKRIHLRALNLRNINGQADLARIDACRQTCRRLREYGFNFFITANYHFQPGTVSCMDGLFRAADETGVLASFSLPHVKDFAWKLDEPAQARRYRELCEWLIRRVRHHPSVVMYAMNHNSTGYKGDQNPLRIDGVFSPDDPKLGGSPSRNRQQARIAAGIAKSIDPTRPVYHHQSGNLGDLHTVNIYLNWAPKQERSDWLEHWATEGVKPLFFVEWGLPHVSSWSSYRGPNFIWRSEEYQSIWDAEFNAAYLGEKAYELTPARIRSREHEEDLWSRGQPFHWGWLIQHFQKDEDNHVRMKALFADDNWRCLRAWGISAMLPWDQGNLWRQEKNLTGGWRRVRHEPQRLKQPGIVADRVQPSESYLYH
ncbi:MAG: glycoside hydrolase family 2 TIM barrel-domain containing protein, partial [Phycisphaerae bacterium]